jgi:dCMP deaminase
MYLIAMKSKDEKTQNGAIIVGPDNEIISTGYNSFPRGINDNLHERQERPEKYFWFEHAERNAIYNAARIGVSLKNCKIYVTGIPCMDCARGIVQSGINEIVIHDLSYNSNLWEEHSKRTLILFEEAKINIRFYKGDIINKIFIRKDGKEIYL